LGDACCDMVVLLLLRGEEKQELLAGYPDDGCLLTPAIVYPTKNSYGNSSNLEQHQLECTQVDPMTFYP
jgi:hypothetical protein